MTKCSEKMEGSKHRVGVLVITVYDGSHCGGRKMGSLLRSQTATTDEDDHRTIQDKVG